MTTWPRLVVSVLDVLNRKGKTASVRLVQYTGKSRYRIHPKHLVDTPSNDWYVEHLTAGDTVLDVGCANGVHTIRAASRAARVIGMDHDVTQLRVAAAQARQRGIRNLHVFAWDLERTFPFAGGTFDAVLFLDVIEHLHRRQEVLREIRRVLRDDGRLLVSGPNRGSRWRQRLRDAGLFAFQDADHKVEYTPEDFLAELRAGGFVAAGPLMPVVLDTPWAGFIDAVGGVSLTLYSRLSRWKRQAALHHPEDSTGFRVVARKSP